MPLNPGERLGPYEIVSLIGKGGMGEVYRANDTRLGRDVAIKVSGEQFTDRFQREARAVAALNHPHICTLYDVGPNYLVMEFLEGAPLKGPLPEPEAMRLAGQIVDALETAHAKGIVHRDLKPANILVTKFGSKLLDFGLAKQSAWAVSENDATFTLTEAGTIMGTPAYMSPEQAQGLETDARSDIFSFGLVLYEMFSGRRAFTGETAVAILAAIVHKEPMQLQAPAAVVRTVQRCLRKAPADRYQTMSELKTDLVDRKAVATVEQPSIAVLPFANLSADKENEYFSDGLAEEILNALTQLPGLRVVARPSAFAFRGREHEVAEIAAKLNVNSVLHGSVRRSGNRIRVSAQLVSVRDESQLWSERYDREMRDVFDIQDEIAQAIVEKLKVKLGAKSSQALVRRYTENPEAHSAYLKGNFHLYHFTPEDMEKGRAYLERAVALEPGYAPAWVQLADYYIAGCIQGAAPPRVMWPKAMDAVERAVAADPELAEAQAAAGFVVALSEHRFDEALKRFDLAMRLNPASARLHFWRGQVLQGMGREQEAWDSHQRAVELDPLFLLYRMVLAQHCCCRGEYQRAVDEALQIIDINPGFTGGLMVLGEAYSHLGRHEEALALIAKVAEQTIGTGTHYPLGYMTWASVAAGRRGEAAAYVARLLETRRKKHASPTVIAYAMLGMGDVEAAWKWLDQAYEDRDPNIVFILGSPQLDVLRPDPRYQGLLRRMNLA